MTQQNAAMVEESTAASHALAHQAGELDQLMEEFEIGEARARGRAQTEAPRRGPALRAVPARGSISMGGAARKLQAAPSTDTWEEF
jgi:methyl-accepting chemotaxis protein